VVIAMIPPLWRRMVDPKIDALDTATRAAMTNA
jgi:hypothetical protein